MGGARLMPSIVLDPPTRRQAALCPSALRFLQPAAMSETEIHRTLGALGYADPRVRAEIHFWFATEEGKALGHS